MKILLINTNREMSPYPAIPIGLACVASSLVEKGFNAKVLDLCFSKCIESDTVRAIRVFKPDAIGLSIRNIDNGDYRKPRYSMPEVRKIVAYCRNESPEIPIIIGGSAVNVMPGGILQYLQADIAVIGDGELTTLRVLERLRNKNKGYSDLNGIAFRDNGAIRLNPPSRLSEYGFNIKGDILRWVNVQRYVSRGGIIPIQTKRGCSFECIYCSYPVIEGTHPRLKPPELVADEIEWIVQKSGIRDFEFVDSVFNSPAHHARRVCEEIIKRKLKVNLGAAGLNPMGCNEELFSLMKEANFRWFIFTPESGSEKMLSNLNKGFGITELKKTALLINGFRIPAIWSFLMGGPGENMNTISETLEFIAEHVKRPHLAYITVGLRIYPDTKLAAIAMNEGIINNQGDLIEPKFYLSKDLSETELKAKLHEFSRVHPNLIHSYETRNPVFGLASRIFYIMGISHPYWRYAWIFNKLSPHPSLPLKVANPPSFGWRRGLR